MRDHMHMLEPALSEIAKNMSPHHPDYWTRLEHQAAVAAMQALIPDLARYRQLDSRKPTKDGSYESLYEPRISDPRRAMLALEAVKHARALIARLKGETE